MTGKTVPFSARISIDDAEFISSLEYDGAHTPSDKLRALLAETRRRHTQCDDYGENLSQMQAWVGQLKHPLLVRQQQLNYSSESVIRVLDALPDLLARLQTLAASCETLQTHELQQAEQGVVNRIGRLNELLLPLVITTDVNDKVWQELFSLATFIHQHQIAIQGKPL